MSSIIKLQKDLIGETKRLSSILREAYLVAKKLKLDDFSKWIEKEMNGYDVDDTVPDYRRIKGIIKIISLDYDCITVDCGNEKTDDTLYIIQGISAIEALVLDKKNKLTIQIPTSFVNLNNGTHIFIDASIMSSIIDSSRKKLLDWTLELEQKGIKDEDMESLDSEVKKAQKTTTSVTYNISGGNVQTSHNNGTVNQSQDNKKSTSFGNTIWSCLKKILTWWRK